MVKTLLTIMRTASGSSRVDKIVGTTSKQGNKGWTGRRVIRAVSAISRNESNFFSLIGKKALFALSTATFFAFCADCHGIMTECAPSVCVAVKCIDSTMEKRWSLWQCRDSPTYVDTADIHLFHCHFQTILISLKVDLQLCSILRYNFWAVEDRKP